MQFPRTKQVFGFIEVTIRYKIMTMLLCPSCVLNVVIPPKLVFDPIRVLLEPASLSALLCKE